LGLGSKFILEFPGIKYRTKQEFNDINEKDEFLTKATFNGLNSKHKQGNTFSLHEICSELDKEIKSKVIRSLQDDFLPRVKRIKNAVIIDEVELFNKDLSEFARRYNLKFLVDFTARLKYHAESYNPNKTEELLAVFQKLIEDF
jgi:hypothetical protein